MLGTSYTRITDAQFFSLSLYTLKIKSDNLGAKNAALEQWKISIIYNSKHFLFIFESLYYSKQR